MTSFNDRERADEARYALNAEAQFKCNVRRNKELAKWVSKVKQLDSRQSLELENAYSGLVLSLPVNALDQATENRFIEDLVGILSPGEARAHFADVLAGEKICGI